MKPVIAQKYRTQQIDLQPYGNTISVEAASDNPYDSDQDVEIYTQASGGMAGPGRSMRSRGTMIRRPRTSKLINGKAKTYRVNQDAAHNGFFPGMGEIAGRRSFMPGLGAGEVPLMLRPPEPNQPSVWGSIANAFGTVASTAGSVITTREGTKLTAAQANRADADARAEHARAERMDAEARMRSGGGSSKNLMVGLGIAAVAAVGLVMLLKRK